MATMLFVLLVVGTCGSALASSCTKVSAMDSLDLKQFMGDWYEHASFGTLFVHGLDKCQVSTYSLGSDGKTISILNDRVPKVLSSKHLKTNWTATAKSSNPDGDLALQLKLPVAAICNGLILNNWAMCQMASYLLGQVYVPLKVLDTDYKNYAILYVCQNFAFFKFNAGFILTRERSYSSDALNAIYKSIDVALEKNNLQRSKFVLSSQDDCV